VDEKFMRFKAVSSPVLGEDGGSEVLRHTLQVAESNVVQGALLSAEQDVLEFEFVDDGVDAAAVVDSEVRDTVADMLNSYEQQLTSLPSPVEAFLLFHMTGTLFTSLPWYLNWMATHSFQKIGLLESNILCTLTTMMTMFQQPPHQVHAF